MQPVVAEGGRAGESAGRRRRRGDKGRQPRHGRAFSVAGLKRQDDQDNKIDQAVAPNVETTTSVGFNYNMKYIKSSVKTQCAVRNIWAPTQQDRPISHCPTPSSGDWSISTKAVRARLGRRPPARQARLPAPARPLWEGVPRTSARGTPCRARFHLWASVDFKRSRTPPPLLASPGGTHVGGPSFSGRAAPSSPGPTPSSPGRWVGHDPASLPAVPLGVLDRRRARPRRRGAASFFSQTKAVAWCSRFPLTARGRAVDARASLAAPLPPSCPRPRSSPSGWRRPCTKVLVNGPTSPPPALLPCGCAFFLFLVFLLPPSRHTARHVHGRGGRPTRGHGR